MKKYEKPMIIVEVIPNTDTAVASNGECSVCGTTGTPLAPQYAPSIPGVSIGNAVQADPDHWFYCNGILP